MIGNNVFNTVAGYQSQIGDLYGGVVQGGAGSAYQNMIDRSLADLDRARQMAVNQMDAKTPLGAYGGSRHGVATALTNERFGEQAQNMIAQQRANEFNTQMNAARGLGALGSQMFGQGRYGLGLQMDMANQAQAQEQAMLNAAAQQTAQNLGYDPSLLQNTIGMFSSVPFNNQMTTTPEKLGLVDYASAIGNLFGGGGLFEGFF